MKLTLNQPILILVAVFTLCLSAYGHENNPAPTTSVIPMADKILAEQAETNAKVIAESFRGASDSLDNLRSATQGESVVSKWLEKHSEHTKRVDGPKTLTNSAGKHSHAQYDDIEVDLGGGWCDLCGCWMHHGTDPNGTPQSEIGHPYVCTGGATTQNCWSHYYRYCFNS